MSTNEESIDGKVCGSDGNHKPVDSVVKTEEEDEELSALLDSALNDFDNKSKVSAKEVPSVGSANSTTDGKALNGSDSEGLGGLDSGDKFEQNLNSDFAKFDEMFSPLIQSDPELKEHWTKLTKSCAEAANATSDEEFQNSLQQTLKTISEKAQTVVGQENNLSEEELAKIWSNLGMGEEDGENGSNNFANIMPLMTNMMQNLLSKELLYPALSELAEKYPSYLDENKDQLSAEDLKRYTKQMELMKSVCDQFDEERPEDSEQLKKERFQRILAVMQEMQRCGSPPEPLIGDVPDFATGLPSDLKLPEIPGLNDGQSPGQCLIM